MKPKPFPVCPLGKDILTKSQAKSRAKRQASFSGRNVHAYRCPRCRGWHVGTSSKATWP